MFTNKKDTAEAVQYFYDDVQQLLNKDIVDGTPIPKAELNADKALHEIKFYIGKIRQGQVGNYRQKVIDLYASIGFDLIDPVLE